MDDKELLEAAARAAGLTRVTISETPALGLHAWAKSLFDECGSGVWNPLTDDGDALRLAVKLNLVIVIKAHECEVFSEDGDYLASVSTMMTNPYAATRRAIVRAAAEIGSGHNAGDKPPQVGLD